MAGTIDFKASSQSVLGLGLPSYTYAIPSWLYPSASASGSVGIVSGGISLNAGITGGATLTLGNYSLDYPTLIDPGVPTEGLLPDEVFVVDPTLISAEDASFSLNGPAATASLFIGVKGSASLDVAGLFSTALPFTIGFSFKPNYKFDIGGVGSVTISAPSGFSAQASAGPSSSLPSLSASGHGGAFLGASVDLLGLLEKLVTDGLPSLSGSFGGTGGNVSYSLLSLPLSGSLSLDQSVTITPKSIGVTVKEEAADGTVLATQSGTLGQGFTLSAPGGIGAFSVVETYTLNYAVTSTTGLYGDINLTLDGPQASGSVLGASFSVGPLGSATLFDVNGHLANLDSRTIQRSITSGEQDNGLAASTTLTASNATQLADYILAIDATTLTNTNFTISLANIIGLSSDLPSLGVKPGSGNSITIQGNGYSIYGLASALTPTSGNITLNNLAFEPYIKNSATAGAGSLTIDGPGTVRMDDVFNNYTGGTTLKGGTLEATTGAVGTGEITFAGPATLNVFNGNTLPAIAGFGSGDTIRLKYSSLPASGNVHYNASTGLLTLGGTNKLNFDPASAPQALYYAQGAGAIVSTLDDYVALRGAPNIAFPVASVLLHGVAAQQANPASVSVIVREAFTDPGETYTLSVHDTYGLLSLPGAVGNGTTSIDLTGSFTPSNLSTVNLSLGITSGVSGHDKLVFDLVDSYGKEVVGGQVTIDLTVSPLQPKIGIPSTVTIDPNVPQTVSGIAITEQGAVSGETYTVTVTSATGQLAATDGSFAAGTLTLTGDLATVNADLATLTDNEPNAGPASLVIGAVDSFGNVAPANTVHLAVNTRSPALSAPASVTIGPILVSPIPGISLSEPNLAAGETFTVTVTSATGQLAANDGSFAAGTLTLSGDLATVNADLATLTDYEPANGTFPLVINAVDNYGYVAPAQTVDVGVQRLAPQLAGGGEVGVNAFAPPVTAAPAMDVSLDQTGTLVSATVAITGGFQPGDVLSFFYSFDSSYNPSTGTLILVGIDTAADWKDALQTVQFSTTAPSGGQRTLTWEVNDGTLDSAPFTTTVDVGTPITGSTYQLTPGTDTVRTGPGINAVLAADGGLSAGDTVRGTGQDYLLLQGAGTFDMRAPAKLSGIGTVIAHDNLPSGPETLYTRAGQNVTIDVLNTPNSGTSAPITIHGNADADVFNLDFADLVYVGSNNEVFNSPFGSNTFVVTAKTAGATINGAFETVLVDGGGAVTLDYNDIGITQVTLDARTNLTFNVQSQATITATTGRNTVTFGGSSETFIGAAGGDTVNYYSGGPDTVLGTAAAVNGDILNGFVPTSYGNTNVLSITDFDYATTFTSILESSAGAVLTLADGASKTTLTMTAGPGYDGLPVGSFVLIGNTVSFDPAAKLVLPTTPFSFVGYGVPQTFEADGPLNRADSIVGAVGAGSTLDLTGGGTYNLAALAALSDIGVVNVSEVAGGTKLTLRAGLDATVNVVNASGAAGAAITIVGAIGDSSTINLGDGDDTVVVLSNTESVFGGAGTDKYVVSANSTGAAISGGAGVNTLVIAGGGTVTLGDSISNMQAVRLKQPAVLSLNGMQFVRAIGTSGADTLIAGGADQTLSGGGGGDVLIGSAAGSDTFLDRSANLDGATIQGLVASDRIDITDLSFARATLTSVAGPTGMTLNFADGRHAGAITLDVAPTTNFVMASDGQNGTLIYLA